MFEILKVLRAMVTDNIKLDVFGRTVLVRRRNDGWEACYAGAEGKLRPALDISLPASLSPAEIPVYIADLCHEWATPTHHEVQVIE